MECFLRKQKILENILGALQSIICIKFTKVKGSSKGTDESGKAE